MNISIDRIFSKEVFISLLLIFAIVFNALLAFVNQNIINIGTIHVMACEMLIVAGAWAFITTNFSKQMKPWLYLVLIFFIMAMLIGAINTELNPKYFRDILLIITFGLLGVCYKRYNITNLFKIISYAVVGIMLFEAFFTDLYISLFNPSSYFFHTRGVGELESEAALFKNAMGFEGRFSLNIFGNHRLSSIFMEQTALGNFAIILALFTSVFWSHLTRNEKIFFCFNVLLIIAGTDSRLAIGSSLCFVILHNTVKLLPRYINVLYMPLFLIGTTILFYDPQITHHMDDNFSGRLSWNIHLLSNINLEQLLGMDIQGAGIAWDSGYAYIIFTQSIIGLILLWLFTTLILPQKTIEDKRMAHMLAFFMMFSLAVGVAVFSIKTTAPLFFLVGYIYGKTNDINIKRQKYSHE